ncbi:hypothetical protein RCH09_003314 [Actimicrobium sp. GrIS 1.19]|uniref:hypothetical protein n=1 Tax=Actimicrobium sp. GrIS 1.19 TaxID=3071708 RepID=UPI002E00DBA0|nr:hypothetical protein [Actimicrobium sp. GrIS 1.19]
MRRLLLVPLVLLTACATSPGNQTLQIDTRSGGQALEGATCIVNLGPDGYTVTTPATITVNGASGDLRISCNKPGYRTSEFYLRSGGGGGGTSVGLGAGGGSGNVGLGLGMSFPLGQQRADYPPRVTVNMNPQ